MSKTKKSVGDEGASFRAWMWKVGLLALAVATLVGGFVWMSRSGRDFLRGRERYLVAFGEIECNPPEVMDRAKFLDQVHYYSKLPGKLDVLSEDLPDQLREGFAKHPWVESLGEIDIAAPKRIQVKLTHRTPVLAVKVGDKLFAVDANGVRLPSDAPTRDLPTYDGVARNPAGSEGTRWGDANVEAAARKLKRTTP